MEVREDSSARDILPILIDDHFFDVDVASSHSHHHQHHSFKRLEQLRILHSIEPSLPNFNSKNTLSHIHKKKKKNSNEYLYQVKLCKECNYTKDSHIDYHEAGEEKCLGYYKDFESAVLVNDAYQLLNNNNHHLHIVKKEDIRYLKEMTISLSYKNIETEVNLLQLVQRKLCCNDPLFVENPSRDHRHHKKKIGPPKAAATTINPGSLTSLTSPMKATNTYPVFTQYDLASHLFPLKLYLLYSKSFKLVCLCYL